MRKRNYRVQVRLDNNEYCTFIKSVERTGLTIEAYLRHLIKGSVPRASPPHEYFDFIRELHNIGNNLNQIARKAHILNVIDIKRYDEECRKLEDLIKEITTAVILPERR